MRFLFTTQVSPGHLRPMVPLAWALRAEGHEVLVCCPPNMVQWPNSVGLSSFPVGDPFDPIEQMKSRLPAGVGSPAAQSGGRIEPDKYRRIGRGMARWADAYVDPVVEFAAGWRPDAVIHEPMDLIGRVVAAAVGVPLFKHRWGLDTFGPYDEGAAEGLAPTCERLGADPARLTADHVLDPCPASLQLTDVRAGLPLRYVCDNGAGLVPRWIIDRPTRPRVCVTLGNVTVALGGVPLLRAVLDALAPLDVEVVAALRGTDLGLVGGIRDEVRVVESLPIGLFADSCDLIVHHGGTGSSFTAITHGVPQLVLPQLVDAYEYGEAIQRVGAGHYYEQPDDQQDVLLLRKSIEALLQERAYRQSALALAAENAVRPSPRSVAGTVAQLAAAGR